MEFLVRIKVRISGPIFLVSAILCGTAFPFGTSIDATQPTPVEDVVAKRNQVLTVRLVKVWLSSSVNVSNSAK
jgi:hypothetical protein